MKFIREHKARMFQSQRRGRNAGENDMSNGCQLQRWLGQTWEQAQNPEQCKWRDWVMAEDRGKIRIVCKALAGWFRVLARCERNSALIPNSQRGSPSPSRSRCARKRIEPKNCPPMRGVPVSDRHRRRLQNFPEINRFGLLRPASTRTI